MSDKKKEEKNNDEDYLWEKYGVHPICESCKNDCKQSAYVVLVNCPFYKEKPNKE